VASTERPALRIVCQAVLIGRRGCAMSPHEATLGPAAGQDPQQWKLPDAVPLLPFIPLTTNVPPLAVALNETPRPPQRFDL